MGSSRGRRGRRRRRGASRRCCGRRCRRRVDTGHPPGEGEHQLSSPPKEDRDDAVAGVGGAVGEDGAVRGGTIVASSKTHAQWSSRLPPWGVRSEAVKVTVRVPSAYSTPSMWTVPWVSTRSWPPKSILAVSSNRIWGEGVRGRGVGVSARRRSGRDAEWITYAAVQVQGRGVERSPCRRRAGRWRLRRARRDDRSSYNDVSSRTGGAPSRGRRPGSRRWRTSRTFPLAEVSL